MASPRVGWLSFCACRCERACRCCPEFVSHCQPAEVVLKVALAVGLEYVLGIRNLIAFRRGKLRRRNIAIVLRPAVAPMIDAQILAHFVRVGDGRAVEKIGLDSPKPALHFSGGNARRFLLFGATSCVTASASLSPSVGMQKPSWRRIL